MPWLPISLKTVLDTARMQVTTLKYPNETSCQVQKTRNYQKKKQIGIAKEFRSFLYTGYRDKAPAKNRGFTH